MHLQKGTPITTRVTTHRVPTDDSILSGGFLGVEGFCRVCPWCLRYLANRNIYPLAILVLILHSPGTNDPLPPCSKVR